MPTIMNIRHLMLSANARRSVSIPPDNSIIQLSLVCRSLVWDETGDFLVVASRPATNRSWSYINVENNDTCLMSGTYLPRD